MFFVIKPENKEARILALNLISRYNVTYTGSIHGNQHHITVKGEDMRLCEMAFQMNWVQLSSTSGCVICGNNEPCGHLTFTRPLRYVKTIQRRNKQDIK